MPPPGDGFVTVIGISPRVVTKFGSSVNESVLGPAAVSGIVSPATTIFDVGKKLAPLIVIVCAALPSATADGVRPEIEGCGYAAIAVPDKAMLTVGLARSLLAITNVPVLVPTAVGTKFKLITQALPGATEVLQPVSPVVNGPEIVDCARLMISGADPRLNINTAAGRAEALSPKT